MKKEKIYRLSITAILIAIIAIMSFTPLGYLKIGLLSITFLTVPIIIGAATNGPVIGAILGFSFGLTSFIQCFGMDAFGVALMQISPVKTAVMCIVPRTLMGLFCGLAFAGLSKTKLPKPAQYALGGITAPLCNTILFMSCLIAFFWKSDYLQSVADSVGASGVMSFIVALVGVNGILELVVCPILGTLILIPLEKAVSKYKIA